MQGAYIPRYIYVYIYLNNMNFTDILIALMETMRERNILKGTNNATSWFTQ